MSVKNKIKDDLQNNWNDSFYTFSNFYENF